MAAGGMDRLARVAAPAAVALCLGFAGDFVEAQDDEVPGEESGRLVQAEAPGPAVVPAPMSQDQYFIPRSSFAVPLGRIQQAAGQQQPRFSLIEIPREPQPIGGPRRPRHALSIQSDTTRKAMRSIGVDANSCALQFRMPTKFSQGTDGTSLEVEAQARLSCHY